MSGQLHPDHAGEHEGHVEVEHHHVHAHDNNVDEAPQDAKAFEVGIRGSNTNIILKLLATIPCSMSACNPLYDSLSFFASDSTWFELASSYMQRRMAILIKFTICFKQVQTQTPRTRFVP